MVAVKDAATNAISFVRDLLADEKVGDFQLDEVIPSSDQRHWLVTVGFTRTREMGTIPILDFVPIRIHDYRVVEVDKETGEPLAMRLRDRDA